MRFDEPFAQLKKVKTDRGRAVSASAEEKGKAKRVRFDEPFAQLKKVKTDRGRAVSASAEEKGKTKSLFNS